MSEVVRGQQGHPTSEDREAGPMAEIDPGVTLPDRRDWEQPEATEEAVDAARAELQQARSEGDTPGNDSATVRRNR